MPKFQDISIKRKLLAIIMIASTVALLLVSAGFVTYEAVTFRRTMVADLTTTAEVIGNRSTAALTFQNKDDAKETLGALCFKRHVAAAALYDQNGNLFATYIATNATPIRFPSKPAFDGARFEPGKLIVFQKINLAGDVAGTVYLQSDLQEQTDRFERYASIIGLFMAASLVVTLFLSSRMQRIISRPISHLVKTASAVTAEKNYSVRAAKHGQDELGQLIDGFNEMLSQIQQRDSALQRAHDELEIHVAQRTRSLRDEIAVRQHAESALQQQLVRISLLNQITQSISERQDTDSILHVVLRQLEDHLDTDLGLLAFYDAKTKTLNVAALQIKNTFLAKKFDLREGSVLPLAETGFELCEKGQTVYFAETMKAPGPFAEKLAVTGWRSAVGVPLLVEDKLYGVLVTARLKPEAFSSGDGEFLRMLSEHVALAVHQDRLHKDLEKAYHELRQTQATVLQQERLKALGQMASGIAHDINNALSPVIGFADLILQGDFGLNPNGKKYLKHVRTAGEDIAHIVARLREFYRTRDEAEALQQISLSALAEQVVEMTRPRWRDIPQSNGITIELETDFAPGAPRLAGIESEVREAFTNLLLNAVDALPNGGRITIRTSVHRHSEGDKYPAQVIIEFGDTGTGMTEEIRKRCLEPFFSTKGRRGTGLGLAMVYGVMERHEGSIDIQSEPGKGTTFFLKFPVRTKKSVEVHEAGNQGIEPLRILCIDDEPLLRELVKEMLERDGHTVEVSDSGQSGLDAFRLAAGRGRPFELVITDLGMPYLDGKQVARIVKNESPETPVLMLTGWGAFMKEDGSAPSDIDGIISKPPRSRELREILHRFGHPKGAAVLAGN